MAFAAFATFCRSAVKYWIDCEMHFQLQVMYSGDKTGEAEKLLRAAHDHSSEASRQANNKLKIRDWLKKIIYVLWMSIFAPPLNQVEFEKNPYICFFLAIFLVISLAA